MHLLYLSVDLWSQFQLVETPWLFKVTMMELVLFYAVLAYFVEVRVLINSELLCSFMNNLTLKCVYFRAGMMVGFPI